MRRQEIELYARSHLKQPDIFLSRMNEARAFAAGAHHPQLGFLVSGGFDGNQLKSTSEISTDGRTFSAYTPLPSKLYRHCLVALDRDDGEFFLAGGYTGASSRSAFIHRGRGKWEPVASIPTARGGKRSNQKMHY